MKQIYALAGLLMLMISSPALSFSIDGYLNVQGDDGMGFVDISGNDITHLSQFIGDNYLFENSIQGLGDFFGDISFVSEPKNFNFDQALLGEGSFTLDQDLSHQVGQIESTTKQDACVLNGLWATSQSVVVGEASSASSLGVATIADFVHVKTAISSEDNHNLVYDSGHCISMGNKDTNTPIVAAVTSASAFNAVPLMGQTSMSATAKYASAAKYCSHDKTPDIDARKEINWLGSKFELTVGVDSDNLVRTAAIRIINDQS
jgi:hypothetical protein